jgi:hypothetical protein
MIKVKRKTKTVDPKKKKKGSNTKVKGSGSPFEKAVNSKRMTTAEQREKRKKMTGSEYKKTGTNRTVGKKVMTTGNRSGQSVDGKSAYKVTVKRKK